MSILSIFKKKKKIELWEKDFDAFAEKADSKDIERFALTLKEGREIDFTSNMWGHAFNTDKSIGSLVHYGHGFYGNILGSKNVTAGDILLLQSENKEKGKNVGKYLVLKVKYLNDPRDMFWAHIACCGHKEQTS